MLHKLNSCCFLIFIGLMFFCSFCNINNSNNKLEEIKSLQQIKTEPLNLIGHWFGEGKKEQFLKELLNEFEFTNQDVKVNMKYPENIYFDRRKLNVEIQYNANIVLLDNPEWDIIRLNNEYQKVADSLKDNDWSKKYLVDFSQIPEFRKNTRPELLSDTFKALYGGIIPGPYIDGYSWPLWCNTEVAKKVGIEVKQFEMTIDDFSNYLKAIYDYNQKNNKQIIPIYEAGNWKTLQTIAAILFFSEVGDYNEIMNLKYSDKKLKAWEKVVHEFENLSAYKPLSPDWETTTWTETNNYPLIGKCLFYSNASWMYNIWLKNDSSRLNNMLPTEFPVYKTSPICFGGYFIPWAVLKKSPNRERAIRFLLSINKPDVAEKWARFTKSPTGIKGNLTTYNFGLDKFENFEYMMDHKYGQRKINVFYNSLYFFGKENENIEMKFDGNYFQKVISGLMTADEAIRGIEKFLKK